MRNVLSYILMFQLLLSVDYETEIQPIFNAQCGNCHLGNSSAGVNVANYQNTMDSDIVVPGNAQASSLYDRITRANSEAGDMPPGNAELSAEQIALIELWINEGALEEEPGD
ncbi:MAG: hypothetical protein CMG24_04125, partial [Candidatus Marinimicrobia bacterium]|nr:hypothetical protein [Candidatus Neomarinimicrobiota bacterium]